MGFPTVSTPPNEVSGPAHQFDETLEEIRAICRLHACPTGHWEDLIGLPLRISQDAGLRFDFIAIVHTLQRNRFNLPDVLDLLVLAIGGASAPRQSHKLGEPLNLLGGFLAGIGHWPSTDFEPVLAPGEVPADLAKFTRPQKSKPTQPTADAPSSPSTSSPDIGVPASGVPASFAGAEQRVPPSIEPTAPPPSRPEHRADEVPSSPIPSHQTGAPSSPSAPSVQSGFAGGVQRVRLRAATTAPTPLSSRPERSAVVQPASLPPSHQPEAPSSPSASTTQSVVPASLAGGVESGVPASLAGGVESGVPVSFAGGVQNAALDPASSATSFLSPATGHTEADGSASLPTATKQAEVEIARALARLERGNLELRAHLDSIDQRIGRMEPRLELNSIPADLVPAADPSPVLLHRGTSERNTVETSASHSVSLHSDPFPATPSNSPSLGTRTQPAEAPRPTSTRPISIREARHEDRRETRTMRELRDESRHREDPRHKDTERTGNTPAWATAAETLSIASPGRQRFSRFSREPLSPDPASTDSVSLDPAPLGPISLDPSSPLPTFPVPAVLDPAVADPPAAKTAPLAAASSLPFAREEVVLKPSALPRGFFGTVPESESDSPAAEIEPRSRGKQFGLFLTVLLLLTLLAAAALIYRHSIATEPDAAANSSDVTPVAAPRIPAAGTISSHGPLTATPTRPSAAQTAPSTSNKVPGVRSALQTPQFTEHPHSDGFRPAGTFVPAAVMEGHLVSAPIPQQARTSSASSGNGVVVMEANISGAGQVEDLHILGGSSALRIPAIEAVRNWRYRPYLLNGSPVEVRTIVRVDLNKRQSEPADRGAPFPP